jgi:hypothetical protein
MIKRTYVKQDGTIGHLWQSESHAVTVDEHLASQCCWKCGSRTQPVYERVELDEERREINRNEKGSTGRTTRW